MFLLRQKGILFSKTIVMGSLLVALLPLGSVGAALPRHSAALESNGCGALPLVQPGTDGTGTVPVSGTVRSYTLHVPVGYLSTTPLPLILNLPGTGMSAANEETLTHLSTTADQQNVLVVYPEEINQTWDTQGTTDTVFLSSLVTQLEKQYCVDTSHIGVSGYSVGGVMAYHLACTSTPWVAAIGVVAGTMTTWQNGCFMSHPISLIDFHGESDFVVSYYGNALYLELSIPTVVKNWAGAIGCSTATTANKQVQDIQQTQYYACPWGLSATLYSVTDGGHTWPGGLALPWLGTTSTAVDASSLIVSFLTHHALHT